MAINKKQRGFALYVAVIFMSVMLTLGLELASLGYKQLVLASDAVRSQYAFYAADTALECVLYADHKQNLFAYPPSDPGSVPASILAMTCSGNNPISPPASKESWYSDGLAGPYWVVSLRFSLDSDTHCADVMVAKYATGKTQFFVQGYDISCSNVDKAATDPTIRFASRGIKTNLF